MVKSCCAVGCANRHSKGSNLLFYRFPVDPDQRSKWIAAVKREKWEPSEHTFLCSAHFISGHKSQDPLSPDFILSVFKYVESSAKSKKVSDFKKYANRRKLLKKKILMAKEQTDARTEEERTREEEARLKLKRVLQQH